MLLYAVAGLKGCGLSAKWVRRFVNFTTAKPVKYLLDRKWFKYLVFACYLVGRGMRNVIYQLFLRPFRKHKRRYLLASET